MKVPLLNFVGGPGVPLLNFEGGPGVPLLNFGGRGESRVPLLNFEGVLGPKFLGSGVLVPLLHHAWLTKRFANHPLKLNSHLSKKTILVASMKTL